MFRMVLPSKKRCILYLSLRKMEVTLTGDKNRVQKMRDISKKHKRKRTNMKRFFLRLNKEWVGWKAFKNKFQQERKSSDLFQSQKVYSKMRYLKEMNTAFCDGSPSRRIHWPYGFFSFQLISFVRKHWCRLRLHSGKHSGTCLGRHSPLAQ